MEKRAEHGASATLSHLIRLLLMMIVIFISVYSATPGMERHEFEVELVGVWRRKGFADSAAPTVEARCAYVQ